MQQNIPLTRNLVLVGGGHAHALFLRMWGMSPLPGTAVTLVSPDPTAAYSGMLPGFVAGHYGRGQLDIDLVRLARHAGARIILGRATGIDLAARRVSVSGRPPIPFDVLSIDIGISSEMPSLPGFADHAVAAKPLDSFASRWERFASAPRIPGATGPRRVAVIGGGVAGIELALAAAHRLGPGGEVTVLEARTALALIGPRARHAILRRLAALRVHLFENARVVAVEAEGVRLADGTSVGADFVIGVAATRPQPWLAETGLALSEGFVRVGATLQSPTDPHVLATGDIAHMDMAPRPKAGVFAVRQAPVLFHNVRTLLAGRGTMRQYRPQADYLKLISTGDRQAVADKWGLPLAGRWVWRWKDRIDRRFMARLDDLPAMAPPPLPALVAEGVREALGDGKPLCGGCGAKVAGDGLAAALGTLPPPARPDVIAGAGDDAAILSTGGVRQVFTTDHLRAFTADPFVMARIAAIHALGDIWAMGARPQAALAEVILLRMTAPMQSGTLTEILAAAAEVFRAEGADIVGGHTSLGTELTIGFAVTGLCDRPPLTLAEARPGDALLMVKPLGSGVVMAAEMLGAAPGAVVAAALDHMQRSQGAAADLLAPHANAMTDVTGFGLAGHLLAMTRASGVAAHVTLADIPVLAGAEALALAGHASSLMPGNRAASLGQTNIGDSPRARLLFDPQTAGPLLAAVPAEAAAGLVAALHDAGYPAACIIGRLAPGAPFLHVEGQVAGP